MSGKHCGPILSGFSPMAPLENIGESGQAKEYGIAKYFEIAKAPFFLDISWGALVLFFLK